VADLGGDLADGLLVDAAHEDLGGGGDLEGDALGGLVVHGVAVAEGQLERNRAGVQHAVADADDLELLGELVRDALDHVGHEGADEDVEGAVGARAGEALDDDGVDVVAHGDVTGDVLGQLTLGSLHGDLRVPDGYLYARGDGDR